MIEINRLITINVLYIYTVEIVMPTRCSTGNSTEKKYNLLNGIQIKSLFKLLNKWAKAIPRKDKVLTSNCRVCELHFLGDIEKYYEIKLPCGNVDKIEKGKPTLKYKAIPTIFPNLPSYLSTVPANKRKSPQKKPDNFICTKRPKLQLLAIDSIKATGNTQVQYSETSECTCGLLPNHIYYVRWKLGSEKKITIDENLKIQRWVELLRHLHFKFDPPLKIIDPYY
ncbi:THAP-type domain-containing protein, partial [Aphis craccivora]